MMQMIDLIKWCCIDLYNMDHQVLFISSTESCSKIYYFNPCLLCFFLFPVGSSGRLQRTGIWPRSTSLRHYNLSYLSSIAR